MFIDIWRELKTQANVGGILIIKNRSNDQTLAEHYFTKTLGLNSHIEIFRENDGVRFRLHGRWFNKLLPDWDTLNLQESLHLDPIAIPEHLELEIILTLLSAPVTFQFPNIDELIASVRIRKNIVVAARKTELSFHTNKIERPDDYWTYTEESGFVLLPGKPLIDALIRATQPVVSGERYSFSCYRATEYVILLGIAQELAISNRALLQRLQQQWEFKAIQSRKFHDIFLYEYGSMSEPVPQNFYVPGDRLWFRNPDSYSSNVAGYEGSWVLYMGCGLFTNFWNPAQPYTLTSKCVEIYHWRHGVYKNKDNELQMNEAIVEKMVGDTMQNPAEIERILGVMMRLRDPSGVYEEGGCLDASREYPCCVCPATCEIVLEDQAIAQPQRYVDLS